MNKEANLKIHSAKFFVHVTLGKILNQFTQDKQEIWNLLMASEPFLFYGSSAATYCHGGALYLHLATADGLAHS